MKKEILQNDQHFYEVKYVISKKKYAIYYHDIIYDFKSLSFKKNMLKHRLCNLGPQYRDNSLIKYKEKDLFHNLYGYALTDKKYNKKRYLIYGKDYSKDQFFSYISLYNNLSYKRTY